MGVLALVFFLSACQLMENLRSNDEEEEAPAVAEAPAEPLAEREPPRALPPATMQQVIDFLDQGQLDEAETALLSIIDENPGSRLALRFLEQLQSDPVELMGEEFDTVVVQPGDFLSVIAQRELGDALQFFALARYNGIRSPRRMAPGIELKIPQSLRQSEAEPTVDEPVQADAAPAMMAEPEAAPVVAPGAGLTLAGTRLLEAGRAQQAIALLSAGASAGNLDSDGERVLVDAALVRTGELAEAQELQEASIMLDEVDAILSPAARPLLEPARRRLAAERLMLDGIEERRAGRLEPALALFQQAAELDPDNEALLSESRNVRDLLVAQLHDQALIHYRDQALDDAIELWQQVGELDPDFEPARVYLERALALRERLQELD